ncbi:MAG TPA: class E sortase [Candidatus Dojkabacteria bacterium]
MPKFSKKEKVLGIGIAFIAISIFILVYMFYPAIKVEIEYFFRDKNSDYEIVLADNLDETDRTDDKERIIPIDNEFSIIIPKLGANSKVVANVDPYNSSEYQQKLAEGVAHAKGTKLPNENGNIFLFAHSTVDFYQANRWNAVFYLINKLETGDEIVLVYKNDIYTYTVSEKLVVDRDQVEYLTEESDDQKLTLMTCWPIGTSWKRYLVIAKPQ